MMDFIMPPSKYYYYYNPIMTFVSSKLLTMCLFLGTSTLVLAKNRVVTFKNLCQEPVWYGFAGGSVRNRGSPFDTKCGGDGDCFEGTRCIQTGPISQCFFKNPYSDDKNFKLDQGQSKDVSIPILDNGLDLIWSGAITGKTGCDQNGANCKTADCGSDA